MPLPENPSQTALPEPILQFFAYSHLPPTLQEVSKPFGDMANDIVAKLPRKLLESKDAAVRARLFK